MTTKRDRTGVWYFVLQRISAVILAIYAVVLSVYFGLNTQWVSSDAGFALNVTFADWHSFFFALPMVILYVLTILAVVAHTWIGLWTVVTDYIRQTAFGEVTNLFRKVLLVVLALILILYLYLGLNILWK